VPNFAYAYLDRAKLSLRAHEIDDAIQDLERAQALDPKSQSIAYLLAQVYQRKGEKEKAERLFASVKESSDREARQFREDSPLALGVQTQELNDVLLRDEQLLGHQLSRRSGG
jgi:DNA-binding SARP family transcriptional activator